MSWLVVDYDGVARIFSHKPERRHDWWCFNGTEKIERQNAVRLPNSCVKKLIGRELNWEDEPVELK